MAVLLVLLIMLLADVRFFQDAIAALNSLQSNFAVVDAIRKSGRAMNQQAIPEMIEWCRKIGYEVGGPLLWETFGLCLCQRDRLVMSVTDKRIVLFIARRIESSEPNPYRRYEGEGFNLGFRLLYSCPIPPILLTIIIEDHQGRPLHVSSPSLCSGTHSD